jgi:hypothetical protein
MLSYVSCELWFFCNYVIIPFAHQNEQQTHRLNRDFVVHFLALECTNQETAEVLVMARTFIAVAGCLHIH